MTKWYKFHVKILREHLQNALYHTDVIEKQKDPENDKFHVNILRDVTAISERKHGVYLHSGRSAIPPEVDTLPLADPLALVETLPPAVGGVSRRPRWVVGTNSLPPEIGPFRRVVDLTSSRSGYSPRGGQWCWSPTSDQLSSLCSIGRTCCMAPCNQISRNEMHFWKTDDNTVY